MTPCSPIQSIAFLKTHKCAGSTVQNVLLRYGFSRDLFFVIPPNDVYIGHPGRFERNMVPDLSRYGQRYSILAHHTRYSNRREYTSLLSRKTFFVTVLRSPESLFESVAAHVKATRGIHIDDFHDRMNKSYFEKYLAGHRMEYGRLGVNQMAFDLGLSPNATNDSRLIHQFISRIDAEMDLVMIAEKLDESLILLKHALCWTLDDIVAFQHNSKALPSLPRRLPENVRKIILTANFVDAALYRYFRTRLDEEIERFDVERMMTEVGELRRKRVEWYSDCVEAEDVAPNVYMSEFVFRNDVIGFRAKHQPFMDPALCRMLTYNEIQFTDVIRRRQKMDLSVFYFLYWTSTGCQKASSVLLVAVLAAASMYRLCCCWVV